MPLKTSPDVGFPRATRSLLASANRELTADDGMYQGNDHHYLSCGASALNVILSALNMADAPEPGAILDFGAGAGRVTHWLRAAFPDSMLDACDLRPQDMDFCRDMVGARTWVSGIDIAALEAPGTSDLIWLGSVATHLSAAKTTQMLDKMLSWAKPGGLVVMSLHGRRSLELQNSKKLAYFHEAGWETVKADYVKSGYGYADYLGQKGSGISVTKLSWIAALIESRPNMRLISLSENVWDHHHDVLIGAIGLNRYPTS